MNPHERQQAELLDRYQRRLTHDPSATPPSDLDPEIAAIARELARHRAPAPDAAFTSTLRRRLVQSQPREGVMTDHPDSRQTAAQPTPARRAAATRQAEPPAPRQSRRRPWSIFVTGANGLATAALVAVLIVASVFALRGPGNRGPAQGGASPTAAQASACEGTLAPLKYATPSDRPIPATPTGREGELYIACAFEQDLGLQRATAAGLVQMLNAEQTVGDFTLVIDRVYADANRFVVGYKLRANKPLANDHRVMLHPPALSDSTGRTYRPTNSSFMASGGGQDGSQSSVYSFDMSLLPPDVREETFRLTFEEMPIEDMGAFRNQPVPTPITVYNAEGTPISQVVPARAQRPERVGAAGPFEFTLTLPITPSRIAELDQTLSVPVTATYSRAVGDGEAPGQRCAVCPAAPAEGIAITLERVVVTPSEARVFLRFTPPDIQKHGRWQVRGVGIEDSNSPPMQVPTGQIESRRDQSDSYVITFANPLYDKPAGEWTLNVRELYAYIFHEPTNPSAQRTIVRLNGDWTFRFTMP